MSLPSRREGQHATPGRAKRVVRRGDAHWTTAARPAGRMTSDQQDCAPAGRGAKHLVNGRGAKHLVTSTSFTGRPLQPRRPGRTRRRSTRARPDSCHAGGRRHAVRQRARRRPSPGPGLGLNQPVERRQDQQGWHPLPDEVCDLHLPRHRERRRDGDRSQGKSHQQRGRNPPDLTFHHPIRFHVRLPASSLQGAHSGHASHPR